MLAIRPTKFDVLFASEGILAAMLWLSGWWLERDSHGVVGVCVVLCVFHFAMEYLASGLGRRNGVLVVWAITERWNRGLGVGLNILAVALCLAWLARGGAMFPGAVLAATPLVFGLMLVLLVRACRTARTHRVTEPIRVRGFRHEGVTYLVVEDEERMVFFRCWASEEMGTLGFIGGEIAMGDMLPGSVVRAMLAKDHGVIQKCIPAKNAIAPTKNTIRVEK